MAKTSEHKAEQKQEQDKDDEESSGMNDNDNDDYDDDEEKIKNIHRRLWFQSDQYTFLRTGSSLKKQFIETSANANDEKPEIFKDIDAVLLKNESFLPFICFKSFPSTWAVKNCNHTIPHPQRSVAIYFFIYFYLFFSYL